MHIFCPQCNTGYDVNDALIPEEGRKLKCSNCNYIFQLDRNGVIPPSSPTDIKEEAEQSETPATETQTETEPLTETDIIVEQKLENETEIEIEVKTETSTEQSTEPKTEAETPTVVETIPIPDEDINIKDIFERLNEQSEHLFQEEQKLPFKNRFLFQLKNLLGLNRKINFKLIGAILGVFVIIAFYNYRYEIVRSAPFSNFIYQIFGIKAKIPGEGLEFQNINWNYVTNNESRILEIKGFISNPTSRSIDIPTVHVELLDKETMLLQSLNQKPSVKSLKPEERIAIGMVIKTPSPTAKYVYMTFIDVE